jgi:hypothetical protein
MFSKTIHIITKDFNVTGNCVCCWIQGSHSDEYEQFYLLEYTAMQSGEKATVVSE